MIGTIYNGKQVNFDKVIGTAKFHHSAMAKGYVSRKLECIIEDYSGKYGKGFKVLYPNYRSTRYVIIQYYIQEEPV